MNNLCFVLMPFGKKADGTGRLVDFDAVYRHLIKPAIADAGLEPIRADEEVHGGIIHKPMFERLVLCAYAVADLTSANANVFYELGIRHAVRPWRTVSIFAEGARLPFDVTYLRSLPYRLDANGAPQAAAADRAALAKALETARNEAVNPSVDSPVFQLLGYLTPPAVAHEKTDLFREQTRYSDDAKAALARARREKSSDAVDGVLKKLRPVGELEVGILIDVMLSYRAVEAWPRMIAFIRSLPVPVTQTAMVQEQLAMALNRTEESEEAERVLKGVIATHGASPETLGLLGRVYKDRWRRESDNGRTTGAEASGLLQDAIDTYRAGFESDWRDAYPGVNAVTLMEIQDASDPARSRLLPIVRYAIERKIANRGADYWDHASLLELAICEREDAELDAHLGRVLASSKEAWQPKTTVENLVGLRRARAARGVAVACADNAERQLRRKAGLPEDLT